MPERILETTASDGYNLRSRSWQKGSDTLVVTLHGVLSHSGWFASMAEALLLHGIDTIGHDRRGSGLNAEARGDAPGPQQLLDDLHAVVAPERSRYRRIVFLGWCLGTCIALRNLLDRPEDGDGLIMMSPDIFECHLDEKVQKVFSDPKWDHRVLPRLRVPIPLEIYTTSHHLDDFIRRDALKLGDFTPRLMRASLRLKENLPAHFAALTRPSMLLLAAHDQIIDNEKTKALYSLVGSPDPRVVELDSGHGLMFDALDPLVETVAAFAASLAPAERIAS
jgi:alpha-beta hydrolase superfamily lysophospholipase